MKFYAITRADGGVEIMQTECDPAECVAKWAPEHRAEITGEIREIARSEVPTDRTFRNAWKADLTVDMPKAREIHRDTLRALRAPKLAALDVEYQIADERGDAAAKAAVAVRKQALRDVTDDPAINAATTPAALKRVIQAALLEPHQ